MNANFIRFPSRRRPLLFLGFRDPVGATRYPCAVAHFLARADSTVAPRSHLQESTAQLSLSASSPPICFYTTPKPSCRELPNPRQPGQLSDHLASRTSRHPPCTLLCA